jgi:spore coat protein U-like protein
MKKIALIAAMSLMGVGAAFAQTSVGSNFTVQVNLTSKCQVKTAAAGPLNFGTYTAFGSATTPAPTVGIVFECTRGLVPTVAFDAPSYGTTSLTGATATGEGVLEGLLYTLSVAAPTVAAGGAATAGTGGTGGSTGTADNRTYTVTGGMASGQAGACTTATCSGSHTRQLIVSF